MADTKIFLEEADLPKAWYNITPDLPVPLPPVIHPGTKQPIGPDDLAPIFPMDIILQEVSQERYIEIPEEVREVYKLWRPTPLYRAHRLEKALDTPARIFYKYEGVSPAGSHKPNTAVPSAYYNKAAGARRIATETGAGQWGSAMAFACQTFGLECKVYMVKVSYEQKPYRRSMMETWGATVIPSPSQETHADQGILARDPNSTGSLGIAISEAVEDAATHDDTKYALGSVLIHVLLHQTVIGQESKTLLEKLDMYPDMIIGCVGGGSSFAGIAFPFVKDKIDERKIQLIAVEPEAAPSITRGRYAYDHGDTAEWIPLVKMFTLGHTFVPPAIHAGGLRDHGMSPQISLLCDQGIIEARAVQQTPAFEAAVLFARTEGIIPAPEPSHAIRVAIDEALKCKESGEAKTILFNLCGHGHFDMAAYDQYLSGKLEDYAYPQAEVEAALAGLPQV